MAQNISLKIFTPEKTALSRKVYRVVVPYGTTNLTLIEQRAPTSLLLRAGALQILAEDNSVEDLYFIDGGVVDFAQDECKISTQHIIHRSKISRERALELSEAEPHNAEYYQMIAYYIENFG